MAQGLETPRILISTLRREPQLTDAERGSGRVGMRFNV